MKILSILLFSAGAALAQPGLPTFVTAGKLSCAARVYSTNQIQTWCKKGTQVVQNTLTNLTDTNTGTVGGSAFVNFVDSTPGETWVQIGWMLWFDHSDAKIHYQVGYQIQQTGQQKMLSGTF